MSLVAPLWSALAAQDRAKDTRSTTVPEAAMPPAGMCRVWLRDVPERQQPAPSDCATAIRMVPRDAIVLFGDLKRAASVAPAGGFPAATRRDNGGGPGNIATFRGVGSGGEMRTAAPRRRQGVVGVSATAAAVVPSAASKAPEAKSPLKPEKPQ